MTNEVENIESLVNVFDGRPMTDSRKMAARFGKRHDRVLRAYDNLGCSEEFNRLNFGEIEYIDSKGRTQRSISMTKDGFALLAMGFTGKEAMRFKEDYIAQFNAMDNHIKESEEQARRDHQSLWLQLQAHIAKEVESQVRASFGSHLMLKRKEEKPRLQTEREMLESAIQPSLLN